MCQFIKVRLIDRSIITSIKNKSYTSRINYTQVQYNSNEFLKSHFMLIIKIINFVNLNNVVNGTTSSEPGRFSHSKQFGNS